MNHSNQSLEESPADKQEASLLAMVPARLRADLIISKQLFKNEEYYVVKDPLALTYQRFGPEEAYLVSLLDGKRTLAEIRTIFLKEYPNFEIDLKETAIFINQLGNSGLLNINARKFVDFAKTKPNIGRNILLVWLKMVSKMIFLKIPLVDPSPWLGKLTSKLSWIWTKWFVFGAIGFFIWTIFWLFANRSAFSTNDISFFSPENLFLLWIQVILIKTVHEFGHATTSRHFGAEVHEMGLCLICFTPCGYVDATDAYMMKYKRHKIYTVIAGIFVEFIIASVSAYIWLYSPPGLIKNLAFNAMLVASINTVFFNMNPLMKFDGYYVISDLLEIPNLRTKSLSFCSYWFQKNVLGIRNLMQERVFEDETNNKIFFIYALAAFSYMGFIIISLSQIFARVLTPFGLGQFGLALGFFVQGSFIGFPIVKVILDAFTASAKHHLERLEPVLTTLLKRILPVFAVIAAIMLIPGHYKVNRQGTAVFEKSEIISTSNGGIMDEIFVKTGDWVEAGHVLARLKNPKIESGLEQYHANLQLARLRYGSMQSDQQFENYTQLSQAAANLEAAETLYERAQAKSDSLELKAPISGFVLTADTHRLSGKHIKPGDTVMRVGDYNNMRLLVALTEKEVELLEPECRVTGRWLSTGDSFETNLDVYPERQARQSEYLPSMLAAFGGPAPMESQATADSLGSPSYRLFIAEAPLMSIPEDLRAQEGMRLKTTLHGKPAFIGEKVWRVLVSGWNNRMRSFSGGPQ